MFEMADDSFYNKKKDGKFYFLLPPHYATLHDQEGEILPKCEVFFTPWKDTGRPIETTSSHRRYFGSSHQSKLAYLPRIYVDGWKPVGEVTQIFYVRRGTRAPDGFHHPFTQHPPTLYKNGRLFKMALIDGCLVDDRGYRWP
jgi:hypothetical protein